MAEDHFGERVAARYDESSPEMFTPEAVVPVVDLLAELAGDGSALELGIGTGRIALPLRERGVPVYGIDLSEAMVARLHAKPGGDRIPVAIGDFATTRVAGDFAVAYLLFNTIQNLTTQDEQIACFQNAAATSPSGRMFRDRDWACPPSGGSRRERPCMRSVSSRRDWDSTSSTSPSRG